jgi:hypothetical protein
MEGRKDRQKKTAGRWIDSERVKEFEWCVCVWGGRKIETERGSGRERERKREFVSVCVLRVFFTEKVTKMPFNSARSVGTYIYLNCFSDIFTKNITTATNYTSSTSALVCRAEIKQ